ncbi:MAG: 4-(cytidine 5'-diphospho)-2-C-methyl-D-erythritol kinase [Clostridia bacterium]|jgi:4-diphosphocytidyl-2-C-methyl-D-erythritol kinase|nr:4-(cytidine 5'-diphospho)-2-C-methyl-D-erythritol kinase [Clostridia bacterium]MBT7121668.1 4-(cytidine 5'-diphospho)-2-C-methyl-D-erythritol kinase [Clostridia bacterium]
MIKLYAYAKLNLALDVLGKRDDGYHELDTVMQSISLCDVVTIEKAEELSVSMDKALVDMENNTAHTAAKMFMEKTGAGGADISIEKRIPSMAGLGGSSADAAAVLVGLDALYGTNLGMNALSEIGRQVGADVPFAITGGTARARGIGEKLSRISPGIPLHFVVVKPYQGVSTAQAYAEYSRAVPVRMESVVYALQKGDIDMFNKYSRNALGMAALSIAPQIMKAASALGGFGKAFMSGSGSSMFVVFETAEQAQRAAQSVHGDFELCGAYESMDVGVKIIEES